MTPLRYELGLFKLLGRCFNAPCYPGLKLGTTMVSSRLIATLTCLSLFAAASAFPVWPQATVVVDDVWTVEAVHDSFVGLIDYWHAVISSFNWQYLWNVPLFWSDNPMFTDDIDRGLTAALPPVNWEFKWYRSRRQNYNTFAWICARYQLPFADLHSPDPSAYCVYRIRTHTTIIDYYVDQVFNAAVTVRQEYLGALVILAATAACSFILCMHALARARRARHVKRTPKPVLMFVPPAIPSNIDCDDPASDEFKRILLNSCDRLRDANVELPAEQAASRCAYIVPKGKTHATVVEHSGGLCTRPVPVTVDGQHFVPVTIYKDTARSIVWYAPSDDAPPVHTVTHVRGHPFLEVCGLVTLEADGQRYTVPSAAIRDIATRESTDPSVSNVLYDRVQGFLRSYLRKKEQEIDHLDAWVDYVVHLTVEMSANRYLDGQANVPQTLRGVLMHYLGLSNGTSVAPLAPSRENWDYPAVPVPAYEVYQRRITADDGVGTPEKVQPFSDGRSTSDAPVDGRSISGASPNGLEHSQLHGAQSAGTPTCPEPADHPRQADSGNGSPDLDNSSTTDVPTASTSGTAGDGMESDGHDTCDDEDNSSSMGSEQSEAPHDPVRDAVGPQADVVSASCIGDSCELYVFRMRSGELRMVLYHPGTGRMAETLHACTRCPTEDSWAKRDGFDAARRAILGDSPKCARARDRTYVSSSPCARWGGDVVDRGAERPDCPDDIEPNENRSRPGPSGGRTQRLGASRRRVRKEASHARTQRQSRS